MKRIHIHISVADIAANVKFYSTLFDAEPTVQHDDYVKWQLITPAVNFALSSRGHSNGLNHMGIEVDTDEELNAIVSRFDAAEIDTTAQLGVSCCYALSNKHWASDPQAIAWESFRSITADETSGQSSSSTHCCIPLVNNESDNHDVACCIPNDTVTGSACCGDSLS